MVGTVSVGRSMEIWMGSFMNLLTRRLISGDMVAEKNRVCFVSGMASAMRSMSSRKPISSISSASSRISMRSPSSLNAPDSIRSMTRPGVPTTNCTPRRRASSCGRKEAPP